MKNKLLTIKNLEKNYHDIKTEIRAVDDVSFEVNKGEFISIVGPSGCGKSTILSILSGLENKSAGEIIFDKDVTMSYMLQNDSLFSWRTILDNCLLGLEITNTLTEESKKKVISLLETYGLSEFINKYPSSLSGGMKQRVALIRTLATNPDIKCIEPDYCYMNYLDGEYKEKDIKVRYCQAVEKEGISNETFRLGRGSNHGCHHRDRGGGECAQRLGDGD